MGSGKWRWVLVLVLGYALACAAVAVMHQAMVGWPFTPVALGSSWLLTAVTSLPGFILLRLALWKTGTTSWIAFAMAGAANGLIAPLFVGGGLMLNPWFAAMGAGAGLLYWGAEKMAAAKIGERKREG